MSVSADQQPCSGDLAHGVSVTVSFARSVHVSSKLAIFVYCDPPLDNLLS